MNTDRFTAGSYNFTTNNYIEIKDYGFKAADDFSDTSANLTNLEYKNNVLTIKNDISPSDKDYVQFLLQGRELIPSLSLDTYTNSSSSSTTYVNYTLYNVDASTSVDGSFSAVDLNQPVITDISNATFILYLYTPVGQPDKVTYQLSGTREDSYGGVGVTELLTTINDNTTRTFGDSLATIEETTDAFTADELAVITGAVTDTAAQRRDRRKGTAKAIFDAYKTDIRGKKTVIDTTIVYSG